jgi:AcrR family transcriptional regulator
MQTQDSPYTSAHTTTHQEAAENPYSFGGDMFALAIASGTSLREAARTAGISESTAYRRLKDRAFRRRVSEIRTSFLNEAVGRLSEAANEAVSTLKALLVSGTDSVRLSAAKTILELGPRLREQAELEERITALEREAAGVDDEDEETGEMEEDEGEVVENDDDEA